MRRRRRAGKRLDDFRQDELRAFVWVDLAPFDPVVYLLDFLSGELFGDCRFDRFLHYLGEFLFPPHLALLLETARLLLKSTESVCKALRRMLKILFDTLVMADG